MNRTLKLLFIAQLPLLFSCSQSADDSLKNPTEKPYSVTEQSFLLDFKPIHKTSHTYTDHKTSTNYVYFSDFVTSKKMSFYDLDGQFRFSVQLDSLVDSNIRIEDVNVQHRDTIYILEQNSKNLYELDSNGKVRDFILMKNFDLEWINEYGSSIYSNFGSNSNCFYFRNELSIKNEFELENRIDRIKKYYNLKLKTPVIIEVCFDEKRSVDSITYKPIFENIREEYSEKDEFTFEFTYYYVSKKYVFLSSWYSDKVFVYDRIKHKRIQNISIKSDHTDIGGKPFKITNENIENSEVLLKKRGSFNGQINRIYYDDLRDLLYVLVFHEQKDHTSSIYGAARPWSLIVYNKDFEKMYEESFEHDEYSMGFTKLTPRGLMVLKRDEQQNEKNKRSKEKIYTFDIFDFNF